MEAYKKRMRLKEEIESLDSKEDSRRDPQDTFQDWKDSKDHDFSQELI